MGQSILTTHPSNMSLNASAKEFTPNFTVRPVLSEVLENSQTAITNSRNTNTESSRDVAEKSGVPGKGAKGWTQKQGGTQRSGDNKPQGRQETSNKSKRDTSGKGRGQQRQNQQSKDKVVQQRGGSDHDPHTGTLTPEVAQGSTKESKHGDEGRGSGSKKTTTQKNEKPARQNQPAPAVNRFKSSSTPTSAPENRDQRGGHSGASSSNVSKKSAPKQKSHPGVSNMNRRSSTNPEVGASTAAGSGTGAASTIIQGMEATTFICLTDVIHPLRHVVKDGVSVMEQGSDAYLDWIVRSLREHEEITIIGMDAAIPDVISLVLRAGQMGIGYQEVRTFTTQDALGGNKSCLQFRMTRENGYVPLPKRPPIK